MPDFIWVARSPLQHIAIPGRHGADVAQPGIILSEVRDFSLVLVLARRGQGLATIEAANGRFGVEPPSHPRAVVGEGAVLIWSGPDQFYALFPSAAKRLPIELMGETFAGTASLSDQSDGRALIQVSGPNARDMLAKLSSLDLDDSVFPIGAAAATSIEHTAVNLWRDPNAADGSPVFRLLVFTSFADSIWHAILDSSAEYCVEVSEPLSLDKKLSS